MMVKASNRRRRNDFVYRAESDPATLLSHLATIRALADSEKNALGFLPEAAYRDAIDHHRLIAMCAKIEHQTQVVGFLLYSGVFPNARVQQIVVAKEHRRAGVATALINEVVSRLEERGYLTISAGVASDLPAAQAFYERNGFIARRSRSGGRARSRTIVLRARDLSNESLLSVLEPPSVTSPTAIDLGLRARSASRAPLYAIDLNVLFDLLKSENRPRAKIAERLFAAALRHRVRLAVAPEFVAELERTSQGRTLDPVLSLARELPRLPVSDSDETNLLADLIHKIVFANQALSKTVNRRALSDARHLAQAVTAHASGYITSDGKILDARERLLQQIGIEVASLEEFAELFATEAPTYTPTHLEGSNYSIKAESVRAVRQYLKESHVSDTLITEFSPDMAELDSWRARAVIEAGEVVAVGIYRAPTNIDAPTRILVHVRSDHVACEMFADHLLDAQCREACRVGPATIELPCIPGQSVVRRVASLCGFLPVPHSETLIKLALGRPVTKQSWSGIARQTRQRTGLHLPEHAPTSEAAQSGLSVQRPDGKMITVRLRALEDALSPTILIWPGRNGAIVPIARNYADELLGTNDQFPLFGSPKAAFVTRRTYFSSPRNSPRLRPGQPILFYESSRTGGRGAVVAVARIVDSTVVRKDQVSGELRRRAVIDDLVPLSSSNDILATSFDNLLHFPRPVALERLRKLIASNNARFQSATAVTAACLSAILEHGWPRG